MADARRQRRMAYLGALAGGLAHEIRNPLSTMKVTLELLRADLEKGGPQEISRSRRRVDALERAVVRLEQIVEDFLRFARGFDLDAVPGDVNRLVSEVVEFFEPEASRKGITVRTALTPGLEPVPMDRKYLHQALLNLLVNARQALEQQGGGEIIVTTRDLGGQVEVRVTDTGPGIPEEVRPRIFEAFFSTKKGGTGLGLPTARRIVEEHGGTLDFETESGKGTSFRLLLPKARSLPGPQGAAS